MRMSETLPIGQNPVNSKSIPDVRQLTRGTVEYDKSNSSKAIFIQIFFFCLILSTAGSRSTKKYKQREKNLPVRRECRIYIRHVLIYGSMRAILIGIEHNSPLSGSSRLCDHTKGNHNHTQQWKQYGWIYIRTSLIYITAVLPVSATRWCYPDYIQYRYRQQNQEKKGVRGK